jgi:hypothetical protein
MALATSPARHRADEQGDDTQLLSRLPIEFEVVNLAAAAALAVHELVVERAVGEVELAGSAHPWPMLVSSISGIAVRETARITSR